MVPGINAQQNESNSYTLQHANNISSEVLVKELLFEREIPISSNNKVKVLRSGSEKFLDMFDAIRNAKHHIHLEYFNFRNDSIGNALFDLLAEKAAEGVKVRALCDAFGNWSNSMPLKKVHLNTLREKGIEIEIFDPLRFPYLNHAFHRDHRKIVVIDGIVGYTGGMNVADYYIEGLPDIGNWRDMHIRIEGDAVKGLQEIFLRTWHRVTNQKIEGSEYYPEIKELQYEDGKSVAIIDRTPRKTPKNIRHLYIESISSAQEKIQIVNPYFLPPKSVKKALKKALERGVQVEIMFSLKSDISFTPDGTFRVAYRLMKEGAEIYLYDGGFHHSKIMMIDDSFCTVGSTNLDCRSLRCDYEVNAFVFDKDITQELIDVFEFDKESCVLLTKEIWQDRSLWRRFVGWVASVMTPLL
ncbi:cardiolipin synthase [Bacteroidales bacterium OttesenSCG-928-C19]|nr:cardiolipin synthase [Bacteroidales bacterium OttesenSCG-928-C19]